MSHIVVETDGPVTTIRLARPEKKNALTLDMYNAISDALHTARESDAVRAVIVTGQPGVFTAGNDLADFLNNPPVGNDSPVFRFLTALADFPKPLIAAVDGHAVGVGTTLLLHCDITVATTRARFALPFVNLGLVPEAASSVLLPQRVGMGTASLWLLSGDPFDAESALRAGLVSAVVAPEELEARAREIAASIARRPPEAVRMSKKLLRDPLREAVRDAMAREGAIFLERLGSDEVRDVMASFLSKKS